MGGLRSAARVPAVVARLATLGVSFALLTGACAPGATAPAATAASPAPSSSAAATPSAAPVALSIGVALNIVNTPLFIGLEKGIYLKHGIDPKIVTSPAGAAAMQALVAGQYNVMSTAWAVVAPAVTQGTRLKVFALISGGPEANYDNQLALLVRPGLTATNISQLKGKKIASVFGSTPEIWIRTRLKQAGLNPDTDVQLINVAYANMLSVLQTGAADAAVPVEPYGELIKATLPGSTIMVRGGGIVDGHQLYVATPQWIAQNSQLVEQLIAANFESQQYTRQHPEEAAIAASHYLSGLDQAVLVAAVKDIAYDPRWSNKVADGFARTSQQLMDAGLTKSLPDVSVTLASELLNGAQAKNGQYVTDLK